MNPSKVVREQVEQLTDLPNIGKIIASQLKEIGITHPNQLKGMKAYDLYKDFCIIFEEKKDPCLLDVLMSVIDFIEGGEPRTWWSYTPERKQLYGDGTLK